MNMFLIHVYIHFTQLPPLPIVRCTIKDQTFACNSLIFADCSQFLEKREDVKRKKNYPCIRTGVHSLNCNYEYQWKKIYIGSLLLKCFIFGLFFIIILITTIDTILIFIAIVVIILNLIIIIIIVFNTIIIISILVYGKKFIIKVSFRCAFCFSWIIEPGYISNITVTFHDFDLEFSKTCKPYDSVRVLEKCNKSKTWELIEKNEEGYCGNRTTFGITSQCERMKIEFKSDDSVTGRGFNATYVVKPKPSKSEQSALKPILRT